MINISEIPSYLKNSEIYKTLVEKKVNFISDQTKDGKNIPFLTTDELAKITSEKVTIENFEKITKTLYFWKPKGPLPLEIYIWVSKDKYKILDISSIFLRKNMTMIIDTDNNDEDYYFEYIISTYNHYDLLNYIIENSIEELTDIFSGICIFNNLEIVEYVYNKYKDQIDINEALDVASYEMHENIINFLIEKGANIHVNGDNIFTNVISNINLINLLLTHSLKKGQIPYGKQFLKEILEDDDEVDKAIKKYLKKLKT